MVSLDFFPSKVFLKDWIKKIVQKVKEQLEQGRGEEGDKRIYVMCLYIFSAHSDTDGLTPPSLLSPAPSLCAVCAVTLGEVPAGLSQATMIL